MAQEMRFEVTIASSLIFPPYLLPFDVIEGKVGETSKARLEALSASANLNEDAEGFEEQVKSRWRVIQAEPRSPLNFAGFEQIWETLQYGAVILRAQSNTPDAFHLKVWIRWCEILEVLWDKTRNDTAMEILVKSWEAILQLQPIEGIARYEILSGALKAYRSRYEASIDRTGFREARLIVDEMISIAQAGREEVEANTLRGRLFGTRMNDVQALTENAQHVSLRESVRSLKRAVEVLQTVSEKQDSDANIYNLLAYALEKRFDIGHRKSDIEEAILNRKMALSLTAEDSSLWVGWADNLARAYWSKFTEYSRIEDADSGISVFERILKIDPDNPHSASGLAELIRQRAANLVLSNLEYQLILARSIELLETVVVKTSDTDRAMPSRLGKCSAALADRYHTDSNVHDIDVAIELQTTAANMTPPEGRWFHLKQLSEYYIRRYNVLHQDEDLASALAKGKESVEAAGQMKKNRSDCLLQYGCAQASAHRKTNEPRLLSDAIISLREADKLSTEVLWRNVGILETLAQMLELRFRLNGAYDDAAEGIKLIKEAIDILRRLTGRGNHSREARCLSTLGTLLLARFDKFGASEDIDEAIRAYHNSLEATDIENGDYVIKSNLLSHVLGIRYGLRGAIDDLKTAQNLINSTLDSLQRRALAPSDTEIALMQYQKGVLVLRKAMRNEQNELLPAVIQSFSEAAKLDPSNIAFSRSLSTAATRMATHAPTFENRKIAVEALQKHLRFVMTQAPAILSQERPSILESIARILFAQAQESRDDKKIQDRANLALQALAELQLAKPDDKIWAAGELAVRLYLAGNHISAAKYINLAVENLPHLTMYGLSRADQLKAFQPHSNLPKYTLAFNVLAGTPLGKCLQLFEQSRSILWDRLLSEKAPISELQAQDAELAQQFEELRIRLHKPRTPALAGDRIEGMDFKTPDQYKDAEDYLLMLNRIRALPKLDNFLKIVADEHYFPIYAKEGPVVVVNCVGRYGHAVAVTRSGIWNLELPEFSDELAQLLYEKLQEAIGYMRENKLEEANKIYLRVLNTLWGRVARPILDKLDKEEFREHNKTSKDFPRLWWVTNGWINLLPIHAAGNYFPSPESEPEPRRTVMDRVISSYIPNFRALDFARENAVLRSKLKDSHASTFLTVSMPHTPNEPSLSFAAAELTAIEPFLRVFCSSINELEEPTANKVLSGLKSATHAHIICHGAVSSTDPTLSHLKFSRLPSGRPSLLDVRSIIATSTPNLRSLFLSACNTGTTANMSFKDESLHVCGAFLMKGCPEVVASRWEVVDDFSVEVAKGYYEGLVDMQAEGAVDEKVGAAKVLHEVVMKARERGENAMFWGSYVHYGA